MGRMRTSSSAVRPSSFLMCGSAPFEEDPDRHFGRLTRGGGRRQRRPTSIDSPVHVGAACEQEPQGRGPLPPVNLVAGAVRER